MRFRDVVLPIALGAVLTACGGESREWMKLNEKYTTEDFRRDYAQCSRSSKLEDCMRARGWVDVSATKTEAPRPSEGGPVPGPKRGY